MTCEQALTPLLRTNYDFITGLSNSLAFECNNGLILSKPACQFVATLIGDLKVSFKKEREKLEKRIAKEKSVVHVLQMVDPSKAEQLQESWVLDVIRCSGPGFFTQQIMPKLQENVLVLPCKYFYPISNQNRA